MVRGGWFMLVLFLLLAPSVSALSMTCPYPSGTTAQATHPFQIRADDASASTIKILWQGSWHTFSGSYATATITEPKSAEHKIQTYFAESYDSSGALLDSTSCDVYIDSANFPGSVSASPSSLQLVVGQGASVSVSASDDDGIAYVKLDTNSYSCYNFGGYPTTCQHAFTVFYSAAGTYYVTPSTQDKWGNVVTGTQVTITVTDPCENYNCDDGNVCTTDERACAGDVVVSLDSCGAVAAQVADCGLLGEWCSETGGAHCEAAPCVPGDEYTYSCKGLEGYRTEVSCGTSTRVVTCNDSCVATDEGVRCVDAVCPGDAPLECGDRCVDPLTSQTDCGACDTRCENTEQCVDGACEPIPGCHVVCNTNAECGDGFVCLHGGHCTLSECQPVNIIAQNESVAALSDELFTGRVPVNA